MKNISIDYFAESQTERIKYERQKNGVKPRQAIKNKRTAREERKIPIVNFWLGYWK